MARYPALDIICPASPDRAITLDLLYAALDGLNPVAIQDRDHGDGLRVFFQRPPDRDAAGVALRAAFGERLASLDAVDVDDEDWARRSQAGIAAVRAGRLIIAPPWDPAASEVNSQLLSSNSHSALVIVIEPSMGFGTGHHATTRLCLELLQELDVAGRRVIDVGTGSGVLAIAAAKLGAASVVGLDNDPDALQNARDNANANGVAGVVDLRESDLSALDIPPGDVVLANLTGAVLERCALRLRAFVVPGGRLIVSGFAPGELSAVADAIGRPVAREARDGDWCAAVLG